ncbi:hypothetical protein [Fictibacillus sp. UD]|uniref:hypothetical protein n=1 Tax=Fictibacillus sp. UD TaxID=3038777 RepID=UPI003749B4D9
MGDSCGTGGQVRHLKVKRTNVAHRLPRGKRAPGTEIKHFQITTKITNRKNIIHRNVSIKSKAIIRCILQCVNFT